MFLGDITTSIHRGRFHLAVTTTWRSLRQSPRGTSSTPSGGQRCPLCRSRTSQSSTAGEFVSSAWRCQGERKTHLDTGEAENTGLLSLEVLVDLVGVVAVDVGLLHERERYAVVELAEARDFLVRAGLLAAELVMGAVRWGDRVAGQCRTYLVAREAEEDEVLVLVLIPDVLET